MVYNMFQITSYEPVSYKNNKPVPCKTNKPVLAPKIGGSKGTLGSFLKYLNITSVIPIRFDSEFVGFYIRIVYQFECFCLFITF